MLGKINVHVVSQQHKCWISARHVDQRLSLDSTSAGWSWRPLETRIPIKVGISTPTQLYTSEKHEGTVRLDEKGLCRSDIMFRIILWKFERVGRNFYLSVVDWIVKKESKPNQMWGRLLCKNYFSFYEEEIKGIMMCTWKVMWKFLPLYMHKLMHSFETCMHLSAHVNVHNLMPITLNNHHVRSGQCCM